MKDIFKLFSLPQSFLINRSALKAAFLSLQKQHHPDLVAIASTAPKPHMNITSSEINEAFQILKDDLKRAQYLLAFNHIHPAKVEQVVLMQIMELTELIDELHSENNLTKLGELQRLNTDSTDTCLRLLESSWQIRDYNKFAAETAKLSYYLRIKDNHFDNADK